MNWMRKWKTVIDSILSMRCDAMRCDGFSQDWLKSHKVHSSRSIYSMQLYAYYALMYNFTTGNNRKKPKRIHDLEQILKWSAIFTSSPIYIYICNVHMIKKAVLRDYAITLVNWSAIEIKAVVKLFFFVKWWKRNILHTC